MNDSPPVEGQRCLAGPGGRWAPAVIKKRLPDGTYKIQFDEVEYSVMPFWYGVTREEISVDDQALWPDVFAELVPDPARADGMGKEAFALALERLGYRLDADEAARFWSEGCVRILEKPAESVETLLLDPSSAYVLFTGMGVSALSISRKLQGVESGPFKYYWNQTRMGGRHPAEVARGVTMADGLAALGMTRLPPDRAATKLLADFERVQAVRLPASIKDLFGRYGAEEMLKGCHPNNPNPYPILQWKLHRELGKGLAEGQSAPDGDFAIPFLEMEVDWAFVFREGEADARVYLKTQSPEGSDAWLPVASSVGMFFWDLAQTGLIWEADVQPEDARKSKASDIGLVPE